MKTKPANSILQSQQLQKQTFVFTSVGDTLGTVRLNTSFDVGNITGRGIKYSQTRYHVTSSVQTDPIANPQQDNMHIEITVRHHPNVNPDRLDGLLDIVLPLLAKERFKDEILYPGLFTGTN